MWPDLLGTHPTCYKRIYTPSVSASLEMPHEAFIFVPSPCEALGLAGFYRKTRCETGKRTPDPNAQRPRDRPDTHVIQA